LGEFVLLEGVTGNEYWPSIDDVGNRICAQWIPGKQQTDESPSNFAEVANMKIDSQVTTKATEIRQQMFVENVEIVDCKNDQLVGNRINILMDCFLITVKEREDGEIRARFDQNVQIVIKPATDKTAEFQIFFEKSTYLVKCESHLERESIALALRQASTLNRNESIEQENNVEEKSENQVVVSIDIKKEFEEKQKLVAGIEKTAKELIEVKQKIFTLQALNSNLLEKLEQTKSEKRLANDEMNRLLIENTELQTKLDGLKSEYKSLETKFADLKSSNHEFETKVKSIADLNDSSKNEIERLRQELVKEKKAAKEKADSASSAVKEASNVRDLLSQAASDLQLMTSEKQKYEQNFANESKSHQETKEKFKELMLTADQLKEKLDEFEKQFKEISALKEELSNENQTLKSEQENLKVSFEKAKKDDSEIKKLQNKLDAVKSDRDRLKEEVNNLEQAVADRTIDLEKQLIITSDLQTKCAKLEESLELSQSECIQFREKEKERLRLEAEAQKEEEAKASLMNIQSPTEDISLKLNSPSSLSLDLSCMSPTFSSSKAEVQALEILVNGTALNAENMEELQSKVSDLSSKEEQYLLRIQELESDLAMIEKERDELLEERSSLKRRSNSLAKDIERLMKSNNSSLNRKDSSKSSNLPSPTAASPISGSESEDLARLRRENDELSSTVELYRNAFQEQVARSAKSTSILGSFQEKESNIMKRNVELEFLARRLTESLSDREREISRLKHQLAYSNSIEHKSSS
jgi:chromosome segregation ATPase